MGLQSVTNIEYRLAKKKDESSRLPTSNTNLQKKRMTLVGYQHRIPTCKKKDDSSRLPTSNTDLQKKDDSSRLQTSNTDLQKKRMTPVGYQHRIPTCKKEGWLQSVTNIEHRLAKKRMAPVGYQHRIPTCKKKDDSSRLPTSNTDLQKKG